MASAPGYQVPNCEGAHPCAFAPQTGDFDVADTCSMQREIEPNRRPPGRVPFEAVPSLSRTTQPSRNQRNPLTHGRLLQLRWPLTMATLCPRRSAIEPTTYRARTNPAQPWKSGPSGPRWGGRKKEGFSPGIFDGECPRSRSETRRLQDPPRISGQVHCLDQTFIPRAGVEGIEPRQVAQPEKSGVAESNTVFKVCKRPFIFA